MRMRNVLWFLLLLSLGLNIGQGIAAWRYRQARDEARPALLSAPAGGDSAGFEGRGRGLTAGRSDPDSFARLRSRRLGRRLGLEPEQCEILRQAQREAQPRIRELRGEVEAFRCELHRALQDDPVDSSVVWSHARAMRLAQARLDSVVLATMLEEIRGMSTGQRAMYFERRPRSMRRPAGDPSPRPRD